MSFTNTNANAALPYVLETPARETPQQIRARRRRRAKNAVARASRKRNR